MFPLRDANPKQGPAFVVWLLILANIAGFAYYFTFDSQQQLAFFVNTYSFIPREFYSSPFSEIHTLFTSIFLHASLSHILGNLFFLFVFGDNVEDKMGHGRFIMFYLLGGVVATLFHAFFTSAPNLSLVGASGAISAILGAYIVLFPRQRVLTFIPPLFMPWILLRLFLRVPRFFLLWLPAWLYIGYWAVLQFVEAASGILVSPDNMSGVAWWAHIGGFIFGISMVGLFLKEKKTY